MAAEAFKSAFSLVALVFVPGYNLFSQINICHGSCGLAVPQQPGELHAGTALVTRQQMRHAVPAQARRELAKAENAMVKERKEEAIDHFKKAILLDPEFVAARINLGVFYLKALNPEPAITHLEAAIKIDPDDPAAFTNLAIAYSMCSRFDAAEHAARVAANLDRAGGDLPRYLLGMALVNQRKFTDEALQCFERTRDRFPLSRVLSARVLRERAEQKRSAILP